MKRLDLTGFRYGRLIVVEMMVIGEKSHCLCKCDCGREKTIAAHSLKNGVTRSCGCIASERIALANFRHGDTAGGPSPEWTVWHSMHQRCTNPNHKSFPGYGGRGIRICAAWSSFERFLADMGRRPSATHSIDRIDNNGNYEPGNCRWATKSQQARNRRPPSSADNIRRHA